MEVKIEKRKTKILASFGSGRCTSIVKESQNCLSTNKQGKKGESRNLRLVRAEDVGVIFSATMF